MAFNGVFHVNENMNDLLGKNQAKAHGGVPVVGNMPVTARHTAVPGTAVPPTVVPTTTTAHTAASG